MGNPASSSQKTENSLKIFWQDRPVKYTFEDGRYTVEEVRTPWDLYVEGTFFDSPIGDEFHQVLVKNGMERVFSIRNRAGIPICDILTRPKSAPPISLGWGPIRVLKTSSPMTVDKQKLIVLDVISQKGGSSDGLYLRLARDFFLSQGGTLHGEHPNGNIFQDEDSRKQWELTIKQKRLLDMQISTRPIKAAKARMTFDTVHAPNLEVAIALLRIRYWNRCFLNADEPWMSGIIDHIEMYGDDKPLAVSIYGETQIAKDLWERIQALYNKESDKK